MTLSEADRAIIDAVIAKLLHIQETTLRMQKALEQLRTSLGTMLEAEDGA